MAKNGKSVNNKEKIEKQNFENGSSNESSIDLDYGFGFSKERAKADLEKKIAQKLSRMTETDLEELFELHEQQLKEKRSSERAHKQLPPITGEQLSFEQVPQGVEELNQEIHSVEMSELLQEPLPGQQAMKQLSDEEFGSKLDYFFKGFSADRESKARQDQNFGELVNVTRKKLISIGQRCAGGLQNAGRTIIRRITLSAERPKDEQKILGKPSISL